MPNPVVNRRVVLSGSTGYVFTSEAEEFFTYLSVQPSEEQKIIYDQYLFRPLIVAGIFSELDRLWVPATALEQWGTISLANPSSTAITLVNTPTFTANQGWAGNGTTMSINTNYNASTQGVKHLINDASMSVYSRTVAVAASVEFGARLAANDDQSQIGCRFTTNLALGGISTDGQITVANSDGSGLFHVTRTASNAYSLYRNGSSISTSAGVSTAFFNGNYFGLCVNTNNVATTFSARQLSAIHIGSKNISQATYSSIINGYMTVLGTNVY